MRNPWLVLLTAACAALAGVATAGTVPVTPEPTFTDVTDSENEVYAGLYWTWGRGYVPDLLVGFRSVDVDSDGDVEGGDFSVSFSLEHGFDKVRLEGVKGDDDLQGELGVGFSVPNRVFLLTGGLQGNHLNAGADYLFGYGLEPFAGVNTIGDYDRPPRRGSCPDGYAYDPGSGTCID